MARTKITKDNVDKFIEEARSIDSKEKAKDTKDYETKRNHTSHWRLF